MFGIELGFGEASKSEVPSKVAAKMFPILILDVNKNEQHRKNTDFETIFKLDTIF